MFFNQIFAIIHLPTVSTFELGGDGGFLAGGGGGELVGHGNST